MEKNQYFADKAPQTISVKLQRWAWDEAIFYPPEEPTSASLAVKSADISIQQSTDEEVLPGRKLTPGAV